MGKRAEVRERVEQAETKLQKILGYYGSTIGAGHTTAAYRDMATNRRDPILIVDSFHTKQGLEAKGFEVMPLNEFLEKAWYLSQRSVPIVFDNSALTALFCQVIDALQDANLQITKDTELVNKTREFITNVERTVSDN